MQIYKVLNNNVAVVLDKDNQETIVMGKGICFQKKVGDTLEESHIDKVFALSNGDMNSKFQQLLRDIPLKYVALGEEIVQYARLELGKKLNDMIYVSLVDHIYFAIERLKSGVVVKNALLWDIKKFYPYEYEIGKYTLARIEDLFHLRLSDDEAGFIALHVVNAQEEHESVNMFQITELMQGVCNIVKYTFHIEFDEEDVYYYRFITHLKFFAQRLITGKIFQDDNNDDLYEVIKKRYYNSFQCVKRIEKYLSDKYSYPVSHEEKTYLTIHIERLVYKAK